MLKQESTSAYEFSPELPAMLMRGEITLAQIFGLDRESLYRIAQVGYGLLNSGNLRDAKQIYLGLVAAEPCDSVFHCHLAAVHHRLGEIDEAFEQYNEALNFNCANVDALVGRGEIYLNRGELLKGLADLKCAIETKGTSQRPSIERAHALLHALNTL
jgi:Tfp pilus assembly protein PilF